MGWAFATKFECKELGLFVPGAGTASAAAVWRISSADALDTRIESKSGLEMTKKLLRFKSGALRHWGGARAALLKRYNACTNPGEQLKVFTAKKENKRHAPEC